MMLCGQSERIFEAVISLDLEFIKKIILAKPALTKGIL